MTHSEMFPFKAKKKYINIGGGIDLEVQHLRIEISAP